MIPRSTIRKAVAVLAEEGIDGVLVGTAALVLHGCSGFAPGDLDFLVEEVPERLTKEGGAKDARIDDSSIWVEEIDGVRVNYVLADEKRRPFFRPALALMVDGEIPVAVLDDVIGLKRSADRPKDRQFLAGWDAARSIAR